MNYTIQFKELSDNSYLLPGFIDSRCNEIDFNDVLRWTNDIRDHSGVSYWSNSDLYYDTMG